MIVHGNRLDDLRSLVVSWMRRYPLAPWKTKSPWCKATASPNGSSWPWPKTRKMTTWAAAASPPQSMCNCPAASCGSSTAGAGPRRNPASSLLDKAPLTWRLMRLLPALIERAAFRAAAALPHRRHRPAQALPARRAPGRPVRPVPGLPRRLAERLGRRASTIAQRPWRAQSPCPRPTRWQAELWRALLVDVGEAGMAQSRAGVHQRFIERINSLEQAPRAAIRG